MKWFIAVFLFAVALISAEGKAMPDVEVEQQQPDGSQQLADFFKEAKSRIETLGTQIQEHLNLPNQNELVNTIKEHSNNFTHNLQEYITTMTENIKAKNPELEGLWTNFKTKVSEVVDSVAAETHTTDQVSQLRTKFQEGVQALLHESENTAKTIEDNSSKLKEDIAKFTKKAVDIAVQASQNLNNQLQQAATEGQAS